MAGLRFEMLLRSMDNSHDSFIKAMLQNPKVNSKKLLAKYQNNYTNSLSNMHLETSMQLQKQPADSFQDQIQTQKSQ